MSEYEYDQGPEPDPAASARALYDEAVKKALLAIIEAIDSGATVEEIRSFCAAGIGALEGEKTNE